MLDTSTSISLEGDLLGVKTYNVFKSIKITNVRQRWFIKFFFWGRISNITLFLMSTIFVLKESSLYLGNITCLPKGDNPYSFFIKKKKIGTQPNPTLQNHFRMSVKAPVLKLLIWRTQSGHYIGETTILVYVIRSLTGTRNTHISGFLVVIYFVKALDSIILEIYL